MGLVEASHRVDQRLQTRPQMEGESRGGEERILFEAPMGVLFQVDETKKLVRILRSWAFRVSANTPDDRE